MRGDRQAENEKEARGNGVLLVDACKFIISLCCLYSTTIVAGTKFAPLSGPLFHLHNIIIYFAGHV